MNCKFQKIINWIKSLVIKKKPAVKGLVQVSIPDSYIPEQVLTDDIVIYNLGYSKEKKAFIYIARYKKEIENN